MKYQIFRIFLTVVLLFGAWMVESNFQLPMWQLLLVYLIPYLLISYDIIGEAIEGIMSKDPFDENFLMCIATIGALFIGFLPSAESQFPEAVFVMLFFQIGELFEDYAEDKSRDSISKLMDIRPESANIIKGDKIEKVSPESISVGDAILIKPGEKVPVDGIVIEGNSSLNTLALTGESAPRDIKEGDNIISGCINNNGVLKVKALKIFSESTASKIINLVESAGDNKSKRESFISKFAHVYTPIVVIAALVLAFLPPLFYDSYAMALSIWLYRALTFLVVSCPCALVISIPLTFFSGIGGASRAGILIKGGIYMDALAKLDTVVFDKTGTLTRGTFVVDVIHPEKITETELLHLAAHVERFSSHPIAVALRTAYENEADECKIENVEEIAGKGICATVNGKSVSVGNVCMMEQVGITVSECKKCNSHVGTVVHVSVDGEYAGHIVISDQIKNGAKEAISQLKASGISNTVMLTGDRKEVGQFVAGSLGIDTCMAELLPTDKVDKLEGILQKQVKDKYVAFVGDGINDAPVLARADVGIAMGALGSDAAIEAADVVLMDDKLSNISKAIRIARHTICIAKENAFFAISIKVAVLILAGVGIASMSLAVFSDVGVMVLAVLNAMRALKTNND